MSLCNYQESQQGFHIINIFSRCSSFSLVAECCWCCLLYCGFRSSCSAAVLVAGGVIYSRCCWCFFFFFFFYYWSFASHSPRTLFNSRPSQRTRSPRRPIGSSGSPPCTVNNLRKGTRTQTKEKTPKRIRNQNKEIIIRLMESKS